MTQQDTINGSGDPVDVIWPRICEVFSFYGKELRKRPGRARRELLTKRLRDDPELEPDDFVAAVHGYVRFHEGLEPKPDGFNPRKWFDPDSIFKAERFDTRLELGLEGEWENIDPRARHEREVKARQAAARERVEQARAHKLRAVGG